MSACSPAGRPAGQGAVHTPARAAAPGLPAPGHCQGEGARRGRPGRPRRRGGGRAPEQRVCVTCPRGVQAPGRSLPARRTLTGQRRRKPGGAGRGLSPSRPARPRGPGPEAPAKSESPRRGLGLRSRLAGGGSRLKGRGRGRRGRGVGPAPHWPGRAGPEGDPTPSSTKGSLGRGARSSLRHLRTWRAGETSSRPVRSHEPGAPGGSATCLPYDPGQVPAFPYKKHINLSETEPRSQIPVTLQTGDINPRSRFQRLWRPGEAGEEGSGGWCGDSALMTCSSLPELRIFSRETGNQDFFFFGEISQCAIVGSLSQFQKLLGKPHRAIPRVSSIQTNAKSKFWDHDGF